MHRVSVSVFECVDVGVDERKRERGRQKDREIQRVRKIERGAERDRERENKKETDGGKDRHKQTESDR